MAVLTYPEAAVIGLLQGVTELFPVSSLGHSVLLPALLGGSWQRDLNVSAPESPYLAFIVGVHVATAVALLVFFRADWARIVHGFLTSIRDRQVIDPDQRLAWLLILATIPVGATGLALEHVFARRCPNRCRRVSSWRSTVCCCWPRSGCDVGRHPRTSRPRGPHPEPASRRQCGR